MKGTSKVIMGATLVMVVCLAVVLGLLLVLLTELYCSLLLRRRRHLRNATSAAAGTTADDGVMNASPPSSQTSFPPQHQSPPPPSFGNIYAQGVLQAPRSFLFPAVPSNNDNNMADHDGEPKTQRSELRHFIPIQNQGSNHATPHHHHHHHIGLVDGAICNTSSSHVEEHLVYISNPIYESSGADSSFKTPDTSPSRLERSGSSGGDDDDVAVAACDSLPLPPSTSFTPPLYYSPMNKKLPQEASVLMNTSGSDDSHSLNALSSSSSPSPCTSPSW